MYCCSWSLPSVPSRWRNWVRVVRTIKFQFLLLATASPWSRPYDGESDHHLLLLLSLNGLTHPLEWREPSESDDKYNNTNDLLRQITNYHPMVSSSRSRSPLSMVHHSDNDKQDHQVFAKTSDRPITRFILTARRRGEAWFGKIIWSFVSSSRAVRAAWW